MIDYQGPVGFQPSEEASSNAGPPKGFWAIVRGSMPQWNLSIQEMIFPIKTPIRAIPDY